MPADQQLKDQIIDEYIKCADNPVYFLRNYVYIQHQELGRILFDLYDFQERSLKDIRKNKYNIILKARQMGISTLVAGYALWLALFTNETKILVVSMKRDVAKNLVQKAKFAHDNLPVWMREEKVEDNKTSIGLSNGSKIFAESTSGDAGRSESLSMLIIDEAAFIDDVEELWSAAKPTLDVGNGRAIVLSTPKNVGSWFHKQWSSAISGAKKISDDPEKWEGIGGNKFHPIKLHWSLHPNRDSEWRREQDEVMGPDKAAREADCDFSSSGDNVIDMGILDWYEEKTVEEPKEKRLVRGSDDLWVWEEPEPSKNYVLSADVARGDGEDNSAFHVFSVRDLDQKMEYQGKISPETFANQIYTQASYYNDALVVVERNTFGRSVLQNLIDRGYKNILYTSNDLSLIDIRNTKDINDNQKTKPGLDTNRRTRPLIISRMQEFMRNKHCNIRSARLIEEFRTFVWDGDKPVHMPGFNDDLVLAAAFGIWVRDTAIKYQDRMNDVTKKTLEKFSTGKGLYTNTDGGSDPYTVTQGGKKQDIRWLF